MGLSWLTLKPFEQPNSCARNEYGYSPDLFKVSNEEQKYFTCLGRVLEFQTIGYRRI